MAISWVKMRETKPKWSRLCGCDSLMSEITPGSGGGSWLWVTWGAEGQPGRPATLLGVKSEALTWHLMPDWPMTRRGDTRVWVTYSPLTYLATDESATFSHVFLVEQSWFEQSNCRATLAMYNYYNCYNCNCNQFFFLQFGTLFLMSIFFETFT